MQRGDRMNKAIIFCSGVVVGGISGYFFCKHKYHIVDVVDIPESGPIRETKAVEEDTPHDEELYSVSYKKEDKSGDEEWDEAEKSGPVEPEMVPYVISPEAFANEHNDFAKLTLVYYEDNEVLLNDQEECVDIGTDIGYDAINHFGEYEKDAVFIRNEALGNDYEVLLEHAAWNGE